MKKKPLSKALYRIVARIIKCRQRKKIRVKREVMKLDEFERAISNL